MTQAKGILPRGEDREVLYKNPRTGGYFIAVKLDPGLDRARIQAWLERVDRLVDELVAREPATDGQPKGAKVAAVAVGFAPSFFSLNGAPRWTPALEPPAGFPLSEQPSPQRSGPLASLVAWDADVLFYVASIYEARANAFISQLATLKPAVQRVMLERGYQRLDETEPFGYRDGVRNVMPRTDRPEVTFVHRDGGELDEPAWADGGSYMAYLKIRQFPDVFATLPPDQQDGAIGRRRDGTRLDLVDLGTQPDDEPADVPVGLPPASHVRKAGPRGPHDDTQIFRRGLPYMETTDGELRVGLQFCSFQASLDQFDVLFNDWCLNSRFPVLPEGDPGVDVLLDPGRGLTAIERFGLFFVPPYQKGGLVAALFGDKRAGRKPKTGRLVVRKRVIDTTDPNRRFERRGFRFQVVDDQGQVVGAEFESDSTGRAVFEGELALDKTFTLQETFSPVPNVNLAAVTFAMDKGNKQLAVENVVTQPNNPYGG
jgi:Dyp-type peroxidase family